MVIKKLGIFAVLLMLISCGGGGGNNSNIDPEPKEEETRVMHDEPVYKEIDALNFDKSLWNAPEFYFDETLDNQGCKGLFIRSDHNGVESYAFAYLGLPEGENENKPAVLLLHGGGGTAYYEWVNAWKERGYVALAVDLEGHIPNKEGTIADGPAILYHASTYSAPHNSNLGDENDDETLTWLHYACRTAIISNSFLHHYTGVNPYKIGVCGVSWGGYITSIIAGYDDRFAFAIPFYCVTDMLDSPCPIRTYIESHRKFEKFDNAESLKQIETPFYYIGSNSDTYSNYEVASNLVFNMKNGYIAILNRFLHSHFEALNRIEQFIFADNVVNKTEKLKIEIVNGNNLSITLPKGRSIIEGYLYYSEDETIDKDTKWRSSSLNISNLIETKIINMNIKEGTNYFYASLLDERGAIYTSIIEKVK